VAAPDERHDAPYVLFKTSLAEVAFNELSFGYQSTISWVVDYASKLFDVYPDLDDPLKGSGVALIDEIDLHVHPRWQRDLMRHLEEVFSGTTFIVTTHSPLILQGSQSVNIALLQKARGQVEIINDIDELSRWRVDQMLTSDLFGLESTAPEHVQALERRRTEILSARSLSKSDEEELAVIDEALGRLPVSADPTSDRARKLILDFASTLPQARASGEKAS
jgi:predicted ATP-binding protein involved in virulence